MRYLLFCGSLVIASLSSAQTVQLRLKFPKGDTQRVSSDTKMTMSFGVPGSSQGMNMVSDTAEVLMQRVVQSSAKGGAVKMTFESTKTTTTMNGKPSPQAGGGDANKGKSITLHFLSNGRVEKVEGYDALMKSANSSPMMSQMFNEKSASDMMNMSFGGFLPEHPVHVGDTWSGIQSFDQPPMKMKMNLKMKLLGIEHRMGHQFARIGVTGTGAMDMSGMKSMPMKMKTDKFDMNGTVMFDVDRGWFSAQQMTMKVHAHMSMTVQGKEQNSSIGMEMAITSHYAPAH